MLAPMAFGDLRLQVLVGTRLQFAFAAPVEQLRQQVARLIKPIEIMQRMHDDDQVVLIRNARVLRCGRSTSGARISIQRVRPRKVQSLRSRKS
jgi:hypothetical protein